MQSVVEVFGTALASYYNGNKSGKLIVRENNGTSVIPTSDFFRRPEDVATDRIALSYCRRSVLNIGASSGEHSLFLVAKGIKVISIDNSPIACAIMHQRGVPSVICGHLFDQHPMFDRTFTWLALRGVVGQLGHIRNFFHFLDLAHRNLYPGGRLILSSENLRYEGYRTRHLTFEFDGRVSEEVPWFDIGMSTLRQIADSKNFNCRIVYCDDSNKYVALLTKR
ncbi:class I SAM-dependent methyltransferase [Enterovibrio coralii]|uniref:Methyltransferase n=1 Tax=Enterovibrio coralii TaxID=294935 RepID=A0A135ICT2_9GAMM|nr:class I SAM-dependent methyltransferase [Enterovibrio coralii]KXF83286.1 methyltransferase [Enterovibrio coralii]